MCTGRKDLEKKLEREIFKNGTLDLRRIVLIVISFEMRLLKSILKFVSLTLSKLINRRNSKGEI
jgi:hypothetical protein